MNYVSISLGTQANVTQRKALLDFTHALFNLAGNCLPGALRGLHLEIFRATSLLGRQLPRTHDNA
jgi:hypothetical protein